MVVSNGNKRSYGVPLAKDLQIAARRRKVATWMTEGVKQREMAERLGVNQSTVTRDLQYLRGEANRQKLRDTVEEVGEEVFDLIVVDEEERHQKIKDVCVELATSKKTYREISTETGLALCTISAAVNEFLQEVGDFSGRTVEEWRTQQLLIIDETRAQMVRDAAQQAVRNEKDNGWDITPSRAAQMRASAAKVLIELQNAEAKLMGLYQQKQEVKITREIVHEWAGVDDSAWPKPVTVEGEWNDIS